MHQILERIVAPYDNHYFSKFIFFVFRDIHFIIRGQWCTYVSLSIADLFLKHHGPCSGPDDHPCGSIPEEDHRQPVCGTNGKSYISPEALWCAKLRSPAEGETCKSAYLQILQTISYSRSATAFSFRVLPSLTRIRNIKYVFHSVEVSILSRRRYYGFSSQQEKRNLKVIFMSYYDGEIISRGSIFRAHIKIAEEAILRVNSTQQLEVT